MPPGSAHPNSAPDPDRFAVVRAFRRGTRASVAIESALAISLLTAAFSGLIVLVDNVSGEDRMASAARAASRTVALLPSAPATAGALEAAACGAIRSELGLDESHDCAAEWTITISAYENPAALLAGRERGPDAPIGGKNGDMIEVRIGPAAGTQPAGPAVLATGVARNERGVQA